VKKLIEDLKAIGQIQIFDQDEFLFNAGDRAEGFYYIQSGEVRIFRMDEHGREVEVVRLGSGDFFGEAIVFVAGEFPAFAQAVRNSQVLFFSSKDVFGQIEKKPSTARSIIALLAQKCVVLNRRIETLELRSVRQRLAQFLLSHNFEDVTFEVELKMKKTELARFIGTIPETLSRNLRKLQEDRLVEVRGRRIAVLDRSRLKDLLFE
jgi:CRP-like cAMP-binding protein